MTPPLDENRKPLPGELSIFRAAQAAKLLTRIRLERPDLWRRIVDFAKPGDGSDEGRA